MVEAGVDLDSRLTARQPSDEAATTPAEGTRGGHNHDRTAVQATNQAMRPLVGSVGEGQHGP